MRAGPWPRTTHGWWAPPHGPALSSASAESRFQPHICVLLQVWGAAEHFGKGTSSLWRLVSKTDSQTQTTGLIQDGPHLGKGKLQGTSFAGDVTSLESKTGRNSDASSFCLKNKNWGWRIFIQTWEKAEQREEGTSRRGGGGAENQQGNSSFWERVERILRWRKLSPVIFVQILKFTEPSSGSCMLCFWLAISTYHMEKPQFEFYNIVWIWYWRIFITEPALNCMFFYFDVPAVK